MWFILPVCGFHLKSILHNTHPLIRNLLNYLLNIWKHTRTYVNYQFKDNLSPYRSPRPHLWSINHHAFHGPAYKKSLNQKNLVTPSKIYYPFISILPPSPRPWTYGLPKHSTVTPTVLNTSSWLKSPTGSKADQIPVKSMSSDIRNTSGLQGMTKDQSVGKFAKKSTTTSVTKKNVMNTDNNNKTKQDFSIRNNIIEDWKWLEDDDPGGKIQIEKQNFYKEKNKIKQTKIFIKSEDFKVIDGFFIPKQKLTFKKIQSRIPDLTVKEALPSPSRTPIIKQSLSSIYHENSTGMTGAPDSPLIAGVSQFKPSYQVNSVAVTLSFVFCLKTNHLYNLSCIELTLKYGLYKDVIADDH